MSCDTHTAWHILWNNCTEFYLCGLFQYMEETFHHKNEILTNTQHLIHFE
jgi:hypothetical protein